MTSWPDARGIAYKAGALAGVGSELLLLAEAAGRTLARSVFAPVPVPGFSSSAMDGWAVSGDPPWTLGPGIETGQRPPAEHLQPGTAQPISTGAPIPPGAERILRSEHGATRDTERGTLLESTEPSDSGRHVRRQGEEYAEGDLVLAEGLVLTPPRIALAATAGFDSLMVRTLPLVSLVVLGSEVLGEGAPQPGQVRDAFTPAFPSLLSAAGARLAGAVRVGDSLDATADALAAAEGQLVISTGGTANGPADHVRAALDAIGAELVIDGVSMRPGHPVMLAHRADGALLLCLPGNPLAAYAGFTSLARPVLDGMLGRPLRPLPTAHLASDVAGAKGSTRIVAATLSDGGMVPTGHQSPGMLRGLGEAEAFLVIGESGAKSGDLVEVLPLPW